MSSLEALWEEWHRQTDDEQRHEAALEYLAAVEVARNEAALQAELDHRFLRSLTSGGVRLDPEGIAVALK